jgi:tetratricopeptide (TPR) repeat protein
MAAREANLRDQDEDAPAQRSAAREKISLVVDRPSTGNGALLILPFAAPRGEEVFGRQLARVLQWRLRALPRLVVGHGQLLASAGSRRRYVPLHRALSIDQTRTCGVGWGAAYVLSGTIALYPTLRWSLIVREPGSGKILFEDTLIGEPEDLLDAPGDVALAVAGALELAVGDAGQKQLERRETNNLEALLTYLRALDRRPAHGVEQGDAAALCEGLLRALALDPAFRLPLDLLAACAMSDNEGATVEDLLAVLGRSGGEHLAAGAAVARELEEQGHNAQAEAVATTVLKYESAPVSARAVVMRLAYQARDLPRARALVNAVLDLEPEHGGAHEVLGNLLAGAERFPGAAIHWEVALEQNPRHAKVLMRLGSYLVATGEYQRAYELLSRALVLGAMTPDALYKLGIAAYRLGLAGEAIAPLNQALQREPERAHIHALLARCYQRLGRDDLARVYDGRALQIAPTYWPSALALGHGALNQGRTAEALKAYTTVARMRPDLPEALYGWGIALVASNLIPEGVEALSRARDLSPTSVPVLCALAMAHLKSGNLDAARQAVDRAEKLDPDSTDVEYCLHELASCEQS